MVDRHAQDGATDLRGDEDARQNQRTPEERKRSLVRSRRIYSLLVWLLGILALAFLWAAFGLMMRIGFLPTFDIGYSWFDAHILYFFGLIGR